MRTGSERRVLVVGGYGHVGLKIAERLTTQGAATCRLAGRDLQRAQAAATRLGGEAVRLDLSDDKTWPAALDGVDAVVVCTDQDDLAFVSEVVARGLVYVDITADDGFLRLVEGLDAAAAVSGAGVVLSVGLSPGLTNLLAAACARGLDRIDRAQICVLLGLGDSHGAAAVDWMMRQVRQADQWMLETRAVEVPWSDRPWPAVAFPFADQFVVARTLGAPRTETLLTFDSAWVSRLVFTVFRKFGRGPALGRIARAAVGKVRVGSDRAAVAVEVHGLRGGRPVEVRAGLDGRREADITARVAALTVERVLDKEPLAGVRHLHQVLTLQDFAEDLAEQGVALTPPG